MSLLSDELDANAAAFLNRWKKDLDQNFASLASNEKFVKSYRRIAALQALRSTLILPCYDNEIGDFFVEAQNDALTSHVFASFGAWRSSLKALRSCIEDTFGALFFKDHPIELRLWKTGDFKLGFTSTHKYFVDHPDLYLCREGVSGLDALKEEYATLSKAVHGSAKGFRMTENSAGLLLWNSEASKLGSWETRHKKVIEGLCLLVVSLHAPKLQGASHPNLRAVLGHAIGSGRRKQLREQLHVHIDDP